MKDFSDINVLFVNTTLKKSPNKSHTEGLWNLSKKLLIKNKAHIEEVRLVDHNVAFGIKPDMTKEGLDTDDWPDIYDKVMKADVVIIGTPIWLGEKSSVCTQFIERLYSNSSDLNKKGQFSYYSKVAGFIITGNEDGAKHCAMNLTYSMAHLGFTIPPQPDAAWLGEVGPGPSYLDEESNAKNNNFTNRNITFMTYNLLHIAKMLKDNGGVEAYGNLPEKWKDGERFEFEN